MKKAYLKSMTVTCHGIPYRGQAEQVLYYLLDKNYNEISSVGCYREFFNTEQEALVFASEHGYAVINQKEMEAST